jgi:hypothetical protein
LNVDSLKSAASGRWPEILNAVAGIDSGILDGKHHPCPKCGGSDRFRLIDEAAGAVYCNQCFKAGNGDGLAAVQWMQCCDFKEACDKIERHLRVKDEPPRVVATFKYRDESGKLLFYVDRREPGAKGKSKDFVARGPGGKASTKGVRRVLYRLAELSASDASELVFIPEGEKHCDALAALGLVATCNPFGAGKWITDYSESLRGRHVIILPDNDDVGREHAKSVALALDGIAASVRRLELPDLPAKGDVIDWLEAGGTKEQLLKLVESLDSPNVSVVSVVEETKEPRPADESMLRVPGFVSEVMDFCLQTAPYPNVALAFCGAICLQAFLAARKIRDASDNRTNIYCLGLANSGSGKDWPRKLNTKILHQLGNMACLGDRFASAEGIQDALLLTPSMLFQTDEIDGLMQSINKAKDARFEAIKDVLLSLHSSANSIYQIRRKASQEKIKKRSKAEPFDLSVNQPSLVLFGTAVPANYYSSLSETMLTNGLLARMLIVEADKRAEGQDAGLLDKIPDRVLETAMAWDEMQCGEGNAHDLNPEPLIIETVSDAAKELADIRRANDSEWHRCNNKADSIGMTIWTRATEHVRKLALIYAASEEYSEPRITLPGVRWAQELVDCQIRRMLFMSKSHLVSGPFHKLLQKVRRCLAMAKDRTLSKSDILRSLHVDARTCDSVLDTLMQSGDVSLVRDSAPQTGRPGERYRLIRLADGE